MMKQAVLITVYKDPEQVCRLIDFFDENFNIYIHIDKKSTFDPTYFYKYKNVQAIQKYKINWGGVNHLYAIIDLCSTALGNEENDYFHMITGQDFPIMSLHNFKEMDIKKNYMEQLPIPNPNWPDQQGIGRIKDFNLYDVLNAKKKSQLILLLAIKKILSSLKIQRSYSDDFPRLYGGSTYWSLNRDLVEYVVHYTRNHPKFLKRFSHTFCAEEFYFPTILLNSKYADTIINDNARFIDWSGKYPPQILTEKHFDEIQKSGKFFARKIESGKSDGLIVYITKKLFH